MFTTITLIALGAVVGLAAATVKAVHSLATKARKKAEDVVEQARTARKPEADLMPFQRREA